MQPNAPYRKKRRIRVSGLAAAALVLLLISIGILKARDIQSKPDPRIHGDGKPTALTTSTLEESAVKSPLTTSAMPAESKSVQVINREPEVSAMSGGRAELMSQLSEMEANPNNSAAGSIPLARLLLQPDPSIEKAFLVIAPDPVAARAFNGYFSFYFDWSDERQQHPVLILDRLFFETHREKAIANQFYSSPEIEEELRLWLGKLVDPEQSDELMNFILNHYRLDFTGRLEALSADPDAVGSEPWQVSQYFGKLEVTYHADRESYCTFLPT